MKILDRKKIRLYRVYFCDYCINFVMVRGYQLLTALHLTDDKNVDIRIKYGSRGDDIRDFGRMDSIYPVHYLPKKEELIRVIMENI